MSAADKTAGLRAARAKDSQDKRARVLAAIQALETAGAPITAAAIASPPQCPPGWSTPTAFGTTSTPPGNVKPTDHPQQPRTRRQ